MTKSSLRWITPGVDKPVVIPSKGVELPCGNSFDFNFLEYIYDEGSMNITSIVKRRVGEHIKDLVGPTPNIP